VNTEELNAMYKNQAERKANDVIQASEKKLDEYGLFPAPQENGPLSEQVVAQGVQEAGANQLSLGGPTLLRSKCCWAK